MTYPHPDVRAELEHWIEGKVDISRMPEAARALEVAAVPVAVALAPDGSVLSRRLDFVEPPEFLEWLRSVRGAFAP